MKVSRSIFVVFHTYQPRILRKSMNITDVMAITNDSMDTTDDAMLFRLYYFPVLLHPTSWATVFLLKTNHSWVSFMSALWNWILLEFSTYTDRWLLLNTPTHLESSRNIFHFDCFVEKRKQNLVLNDSLGLVTPDKVCRVSTTITKEIKAFGTSQTNKWPQVSQGR